MGFFAAKPKEIEYNMFIDEYHMTPEQFLSSDKNEN